MDEICLQPETCGVCHGCQKRGCPGDCSEMRAMLKARVCPGCGGKLRGGRCVQTGACGRDWTRPRPGQVRG